MTSSDISQLVDQSISPAMVVDRMIRILASQAIDAPPTAASDAQRIHRKRASYSSCMCSYCAAIKTYVHLKRRVKRLQDDMWVDPSGATDRLLDRAISDLSVAIGVKNAAKVTGLARRPVPDST